MTGSWQEWFLQHGMEWWHENSEVLGLKQQAQIRHLRWPEKWQGTHTNFTWFQFKDTLCAKSQTWLGVTCWENHSLLDHPYPNFIKATKLTAWFTFELLEHLWPAAPLQETPSGLSGLAVGHRHYHALGASPGNSDIPEHCIRGLQLKVQCPGKWV